MRVQFAKWLVLAGLTVVLGFGAPRTVQGQNEAPPPPTGDDNGWTPTDVEVPKTKARPKPLKDPVAAAFALPKKVVLNAEQQAAYDKLKEENQAGLRDALDKLAQAGPEEKAAAAKEVARYRAKVRAGIQNILRMAPRAEQSNPLSPPDNSSRSYSPGTSGNPYPAAYPPSYGYYPGYLGGYPPAYPGWYYPRRYYRDRYPPYLVIPGVLGSGSGDGKSKPHTTGKPPTGNRPPTAGKPRPPSKPMAKSKPKAK